MQTKVNQPAPVPATDMVVHRVRGKHEVQVRCKDLRFPGGYRIVATFEDYGQSLDGNLVQAQLFSASHMAHEILRSIRLDIIDGVDFDKETLLERIDQYLDKVWHEA